MNMNDLLNNSVLMTLSGIIGILSIGVLVLKFVDLCKKVFGRRPPMDEQMKELVKTLRGEIQREKNSVLKETRLKMDPITDRLDRAEENIADIQLDRERKWNLLQQEIQQQSNDLAYIKGKLKGAEDAKNR